MQKADCQLSEGWRVLRMHVALGFIVSLFQHHYYVTISTNVQHGFLMHCLLQDALRQPLLAYTGEFIKSARGECFDDWHLLSWLSLVALCASQHIFVVILSVYI